MKKLLLFGFILLFSFCEKEPTNQPKDVIELLPLDGEISGWNRSSAIKIAENETQLFDLIDGEGQVYVDNGFVKCSFQNYAGDLSGTTTTLELRIYDMGDTTNSKNLYTAVATGSETPWTDNHAGVEARIDESLLFDYRIDFWQDKFYVWLTIQNKTDPGLAIGKFFANNVSAAVTEE